ncbi:hypothetical protein [Gibbsiella quercinecans]|uniref:hypothetical protein n=1 Tax=Gibbsiella quercinecans TaxID=929813 RepID=UPI003A4DC072
MKPAYANLTNQLLQQYHQKIDTLRALPAVAEEVRQFSQNDHAFRLSVGLEGLLSVARAAGDTGIADTLEGLISECNYGKVPEPFCVEYFSA